MTKTSNTTITLMTKDQFTEAHRQFQLETTDARKAIIDTINYYLHDAANRMENKHKVCVAFGVELTPHLLDWTKQHLIEHGWEHSAWSIDSVNRQTHLMINLPYEDTEQ